MSLLSLRAQWYKNKEIIKLMFILSVAVTQRTELKIVLSNIIYTDDPLFCHQCHNTFSK